MTLQVMGTAYCAADPILIQTKNNKCKAEIPVYIKDVWTDHATGEVREVNDTFRCVFWGENARRVNQLLMKGSQIIITSAKLRTIFHPNNTKVSYTQIWVDRWEVPTKVLMTKSFYNEIYKSELLPYKLFIVEISSSQYSIEIHVDKHTMTTHADNYFKYPIQFELKVKDDEEVLYSFILNKNNLKMCTSAAPIMVDRKWCIPIGFAMFGCE